MILDAFELSKNDGRTNNLSWLRSVPFVSYGYVSSVVDLNTVVVSPVVQRDGDFVREVNVTLLHPASTVFECAAAPEINDLVLLFSLDAFHPAMFNSPATRVVEGEEDAQPTLFDEEQLGYTSNAMVGLLMSTVKYAAVTRASLEGAGEDSSFALHCGAAHNTVAVEGNLLMYAQAGGEGEFKVRLAVAPTHELEAQFQSKTEVKYGFMLEDAEGKEYSVAAPLEKTHSRLSPVKETHQAAVDITYGEPEDAEETDLNPKAEAPVTVLYDKNAPLSLTHNAPVTSVYSEDAPQDVTADAEVTITLGDKADVTIESSAAFKMTFKKTFDLEFDDVLNFISKADINIKSSAAGILTLGNSVATLGAMVEEFIDIVTALDTVGSPAAQNTGPVAKGKLAALKIKWGQVFK